MAHAGEKLLDKVHLVGLVPFGEVRQTGIALGLKRRRRFFLPRRIVQYLGGVLQKGDREGEKKEDY